MAKSKTKFSGKLGGEVYKQTRKGEYVSKAAGSVTEAQLANLSEQNARTAAINKLAGQINRIIPYYDKTLKNNDFYGRLKKRFFRQSFDDRILLLNSALKMEIHLRHTLEKLNPTPAVSMEPGESGVVVTLTPERHPLMRSTHNCYYFEVIFICWRKHELPPVHWSKKTSWIYIRPEIPVFEFNFPRPEDGSDFLVCVLEVLGEDSIESGFFPTLGMQLVNCGSLDPASQKMLDDQRQADRQALIQERGSKRKEEPVEERVEPKGFK